MQMNGDVREGGDLQMRMIRTMNILNFFDMSSSEILSCCTMVAK